MQSVGNTYDVRFRNGKDHWSRYEQRDGRCLPGFGKRSTFLINVFFAHMPQLATVETLLRLSNRHYGTLYSLLSTVPSSANWMLMNYHYGVLCVVLASAVPTVNE